HLVGTRVDLGLILSNDGIHFREPVTDFKMIAHGAEGKDWDSIALLQGHAFANVGDKTYVWYSHWDCEGLFRSQEIGLATWRRDGFGFRGLHQPKGGGSVMTRPLSAGDDGAILFYNAAQLGKDTPLTVELLDEHGNPIAAYAGKNAARLTEDGLH